MPQESLSTREKLFHTLGTMCETHANGVSKIISGIFYYLRGENIASIIQIITCQSKIDYHIQTQLPRYRTNIGTSHFIRGKGEGTCKDATNNRLIYKIEI